MLLLVTLGWCAVSVVAAALWCAVCSGARAGADVQRAVFEPAGATAMAIPAPRAASVAEPALV